MTKAYRILFLYIPLITVALFVALMSIPRSVFIPWEYLNIWTVLKAFFLSYILLGVISMVMRFSEMGLHLILAAVAIGFVSVGMCWLSFGRFNYIASWSYTPAFSVIFGTLMFVGFLVIVRCRHEQ
jgi:hypothetical protein